MNTRPFLRFVKLPKLLAISLFLFMAVIPPLAVWVAGREIAVEALRTEARILAVVVSRVIGQSPTFWNLTPERLSHVIQGLTPTDCFIDISDIQGNIVLTSGDPPSRPVMSARRFLVDRDEPVGSLTVYGSLRGHLKDTLFTAIVSFAFSIAITVLLWKKILQIMRNAALRVQHGMQRFQMLTELSNDGYWETDADLRFIFLSGGMERIGIKKEVFGGMLITELPFGNTPGVRERLHHMLFAREVFRNLVVNLEIEGRSRWILVSGEPLFDERDAFLGYHGTATDITERKHGEEALRAANAYNRGLLEASVDPLVTISPDGKISDANKATENITGCPREEIIGTNFSSYFTDKAKAEAGYQRVFHDGFIREYGLTLLHKDGFTTPVVYNASLYKDESGEVAGVFAAVRDITERKKAEELRDEIERIVQHDLRSPAVAAITVARALAEDLNLGENERNLMVLLENSGQRMLDTLNQTLVLYKINTGSYKYVATEIDGVAIVREISRAFLLLPGFSKNRISIRVDGKDIQADASFCFFFCDPQLLRLALQNLIQNALEASDQNNEVIINLICNGNIKIEIYNKGAVPIEIRNTFFDKYVTFGKKSGTGIGTYSARIMIEAQGGSIAMQTSDETDETLITIHLPS